MLITVPVAWIRRCICGGLLHSSKRDYASASAKTQKASRHPLLIIFDLNGTLLDRRTKRYRPLADSSSVPEPDFKLGGKYFYYLRPHLQSLFDYCFKHFRVGIWTSALPSNAYSSVVRVLGPALSLESTMLDFEAPGAMSQDACRAAAMHSASTAGSNKCELDWLSCASFNSEQEMRIRLEALELLAQIQASASPLSPPAKAAHYPLALLWTRRRCLLRNTCQLDKTDNPFKPVAMKDLSQLWQKRPRATASKANSAPLARYTRFVIGESNSAKELLDSSDGLSTAVPEPFYLPPIPYYLGHKSASVDKQSAWEKHLQFKPSHTLIVDDSEYKFALTRRNGLVLPEYSIDNDPDRKDTTLLALVQYLQGYCSHGGDMDIRAYMEHCSFQQFCEQRAG